MTRGEILRANCCEVKIPDERCHVFCVIRIGRTTYEAQPVIRRKNRGNEDDRRRWKYSSNSARVETRNRSRTFCRSFAQQHVCDDEARNDEKYVYAKEAAMYSRYAGVIKNDEQYGEGANRLNIGAELSAIVICVEFIGARKAQIGALLQRR